MTRPLRIGYLVPRFPGRTHMCFWREALALEAMGHDVRLLSTRKPPPERIGEAWSDEAAARTIYLDTRHPVAAARAATALASRSRGVPILRSGPGFPRATALALGAAWRLRSRCAADRIDHVHVHSCGQAALIAALAARIGGPSYSLTLHGPLADAGPGQRFKWSEAAFATIVSDRLREEAAATLGDALPARVIVRPVGVDTGLFERDTPYEPVSHGRPMRLFSSGPLARAKGHQDVISAVRQLLDLGVDVRLEIAGEDDAGGTGYRRELETHLKQLHLRDHVKLLGAIAWTDLRARLLAADAFVRADRDEPPGMACMEAMACGVPTIGTDAGGLSDLIRDGRTGILVPPRNPGGLARAIRDFAANPDYARDLSAAGRAHVAARYRTGFGAQVLAEEIARLPG